MLLLCCCHMICFCIQNTRIFPEDIISAPLWVPTLNLHLCNVPILGRRESLLPLDLERREPSCRDVASSAQEKHRAKVKPKEAKIC